MCVDDMKLLDLKIERPELSDAIMSNAMTARLQAMTLRIEQQEVKIDNHCPYATPRLDSFGIGRVQVPEFEKGDASVWRR